MANEKRLIDANDIPYEEFYVPSGDNQWKYKKDLCVCKSAVDKMPTVDAVEVVRCKDCRHCKPDENIIGAYGDCDRFDRDNDNSVVSADDFCSYGERREGE